MREFHATLQLDASAAAVWLEMADVVTWPQWMATFARVEALDGRELALGRRFRVLQPKLRPALWVVTQLSPVAGFTWESRAPGLRMTARHRLEPAGAGTTLRLEFAFAGLLAPLIARLWGELVQDYLQRECAAYRERLQLRAAAR